VPYSIPMYTGISTGLTPLFSGASLGGDTNKTADRQNQLQPHA